MICYCVQNGLFLGFFHFRGKTLCLVETLRAKLDNNNNKKMVFYWITFFCRRSKWKHVDRNIERLQIIMPCVVQTKQQLSWFEIDVTTNQTTNEEEEETRQFENEYTQSNDIKIFVPHYVSLYLTQLQFNDNNEKFAPNQNDNNEKSPTKKSHSWQLKQGKQRSKKQMCSNWMHKHRKKKNSSFSYSIKKKNKYVKYCRGSCGRSWKWTIAILSIFGLHEYVDLGMSNGLG